MNMNVARTAEQRIFEMVMFQIGDSMGHIRFTRQERLLENHFTAATDTRNAFHMIRQRAHIKLWPQRGLTQLGMGKPEIILLFRHMIGKFVGKAETETKRRAIGADQVNACKLRFLTAVFSKSR